MNTTRLSPIIVLAVIFLISCADTPKWQKGARIDGTVGAGAGAIIGHQSDHEVETALIGGAAGAVVGGLIGPGFFPPAPKRLL